MTPSTRSEARLSTTEPVLPGHRRGGRRFTTQLDREWHRIRRDERRLRAARSWADQAPPTIGPDRPLARLLPTLDDLGRLVDLTQQGGEDGDEILVDLLVLARTDELAGRIVLQRILPGILARSRRYRDFQIGNDTADIVIAAAWMTLRTYDYERRARHVAASLISDTVFTAFRQPHRRRSATEQPLPTDAWAGLPAGDRSTTAFEELADVVGEARRLGVDAEALDLLRALVRTGSSSIVAVERGVSPRTIRNRRDRAIACVREAVLPAAA